ncbi:hypothetical protein Lesp02_78350 [Lentzea sp. NBRC 105346]|uniref:hypothetical protein n=1 Tax=Lentzea sp. NBRC 105346 TaxID=3032205 RepID=UPI0024A427F5|nr:hypothetical protein [Lentzea sp. NBRC 105346]GLZ35648.1 hypothetical protein Lesp02_78350 [Lentzea sp. NBRC 105346]
MEPVEINAGELYLRALRSDDRIDDAPALAGEFPTVEAAREYIRGREAAWADDTVYSWAACDATTASVLAVIELIVDAGTATPRTYLDREVGQRALAAVLPWAEQAAGLRVLS